MEKISHSEVVEFTKLAKAEQDRESLMIEEGSKQQKYLMHV